MEKVIIIGAGLTGLSAGIALQKEGIDTEIFEMAPWPGGVCTGWTRLGYTFDGCVHWMVGTKEGGQIRKMYEKVNALKPDSVIYHLDKITLEIDGKVYDIPLEIVSFQDFLLDIAPEDSLEIVSFCKEINKVSKSHLMSGSPQNIKELLYAITKGRTFLKTIIKSINVTVSEYCQRFNNELIVKIIYHLMLPSMSVFALFMMLGTRMGKNGGFPKGGAKEIIGNMNDYYLSLGGKITYNTKIEEIVIEDGIALGVKRQQQVYFGSYVISACDLHYTVNHMLKGNYPHPVLNKMLEEMPLFDPIMLISLGLDKKFPIPQTATLNLPKSLDTGGKTMVNNYHIRTFDFDESFAPKNCSSVMVTLSADFDYWQSLREKDHESYKQKKEQVTKNMIDFLELRYPGIKSYVKVFDVTTPSSYFRINNLFKGSYEGFLPIPKALSLKISKEVPGLKNLILAGQWITPGGGILPAILDGIRTAKTVQKKLRKN